MEATATNTLFAIILRKFDVNPALEVMRGRKEKQCS